MNPRIQELAKQAEIKFEATLEHSGIDTAVIIPADLEKFAELIVRKCAYIVENSPWVLDRGYKAVDQANLVKEHFGVK